VAALYFDELVILNPVGASRETISMDHHYGKAIKVVKKANNNSFFLRGGIPKL